MRGIHESAHGRGRSARLGMLGNSDVASSNVSAVDASERPVQRGMRPPDPPLQLAQVEGPSATRSVRQALGDERRADGRRTPRPSEVPPALRFEAVRAYPQTWHLFRR
jgi:hypothetical protein